MSAKKKTSSDLKRLGDPIGRLTLLFIVCVGFSLSRGGDMKVYRYIYIYIYIEFFLFFTDDILKRNLYFTKLNKLADHHLGRRGGGG